MPALKSPSRLNSGGWGFRIATLVVILVLGIVIGWGLYGNTSSPLSFTSDPGAKPDGVESKFDIKAIVGLLRGAPETLGIKPAEVDNTYLIVDPSGNRETPEAVVLSIYVSSEFDSGSIELYPDGTQKQINYPT